MRCYAVLASVSRGYPPLEGRLVTCYSPGRHFTHGLLHFLVRLACVRHAASVDSEPGSNSHLKPVRLPTGSWQTAIAAFSVGSSLKLLPVQRRGMAPPFSLRLAPKSKQKFTAVYLVRSFRTYARIRSLTTGTFNRVVKDRIGFRLSGAPSVLGELTARVNPTVLETL